MEAHNICINSTYHWQLFLKNPNFNVHYPYNNGRYDYYNDIKHTL